MMKFFKISECYSKIAFFPTPNKKRKWSLSHIGRPRVEDLLLDGFFRVYIIIIEGATIFFWIN